MEYVIIGAVVATALACPVLMCGPMLLRRFGIIKGGDAGMSCTGMMPGERTSQDQQRRDLIARRDEIDAEIARVESHLGGGAADEPSPHTGTPHSTTPA
jgi:hypothetical protein